MSDDDPPQDVVTTVCAGRYLGRKNDTGAPLRYGKTSRKYEVRPFVPPILDEQVYCCGCTENYSLKASEPPKDFGHPWLQNFGNTVSVSDALTALLRTMKSVSVEQLNTPNVVMRTNINLYFPDLNTEISKYFQFTGSSASYPSHVMLHSPKP